MASAGTIEIPISSQTTSIVITEAAISIDGPHRSALGNVRKDVGSLLCSSVELETARRHNDDVWLRGEQ